MNFNRHYNLEGAHAPFSPSQAHWLRYDDEKALDVFMNKRAAELGTKLHQWAKDTIDLGIKQPKSKKTLCAYVNDAIGFKMSTEVVLFHSKRFFGTADTISFRESEDGTMKLRIHDLKTGKTPVHIEQLEVYAALFCLEYKVNPADISIELRIYQNDDIVYHYPTPDDIIAIMKKIVHLDKLLDKAEREEV